MRSHRWWLALLFVLLPTLGLASPAGAQQAGIRFSQLNNQTVTESQFQTLVYICSPNPLSSYMAQHSYDGGLDDVPMGDGIWANCDQGLYPAGFVVDLTLQPGSNTLYITASDGWSWSEFVGLNITYQGDAGPIVEVGTAAMTAQMIPGAITSREFRLYNGRSGYRAFNLAVTCSGAVTCTGMTQPTSIGIQSMTATGTWVNYSVSGATGATGTLTLTATDMNDPLNTHAATANVQILPTGAIQTQELCLSVAAGPGASVECGALRLAHALPAVRTINQARAPVLTYNSQHAHPFPIVALSATLPGGSPTPDSVVTTVVLNGVPYRRSVPGSQFPAGQARRAVVPIDALGLATGLYDYTIEVRRFTAGTSAVLASGSGALPIVNRSASAFGAGWWLAGYEELQTLPNNRVLWIGGDGSTKVYEQMGTSGAQAIYMAPRQSYSDTLIKNTADNTWQRRLPNGGWVGFNAALKHASTTNRVGYQTTFTQDGSQRLATISVPPAGAGMAWTFAYTSGRLDSVFVADSVPGTNRVLQVTVDGSGRLTQLLDPGLPALTFGYDATVTRRVVSRTDRRSGVARWAYDAAHRLASSTLRLTATDSALVTYCAGESMGLTSCQGTLVAPTEVRTVVNGARTDVPDITTVWLDGTGAPTQIQDAIGGTTQIVRGDARFPALPTRLQQPDGRVTGAFYDERGNLRASVDSSLVVGGQRSMTRYEWHPKWNEPTLVTSPAGDYVRFDYDLTTGNLLWQEDARGTASRTSYAYDANGRLVYAEKPGGARDSVYYDAVRWNVSGTRSAVGKRIDFVTDQIGRVKVSRKTIAAGVTQDDSISYDRLGRVIRQVSYAPAFNTSSAQKLVVVNGYDDEGNLTSLTRTISPTTGGLSSLTTTWGYDLAGRRVVEVSPDSRRDSTAYDVAGNPILRVTRRGDTLYTQYDTLNRAVRTVATAATDVPAYRAGAAARDTTKALNTPYGGFVHTRDTTTFEYDVMGRIVRAANRDARIRRTYTAFGALDRDSLWIKTWARTGEHAYGMRYEYDIAGRITSLWYPTQLVQGTQGRATYQYNVSTGLLSQVTGLQSEQFAFTFNNRNELTQLSMPGGITEVNAYDNDGLVAMHRVHNGTPTNLQDRFSGTWIDSTRVKYDLRGKIDSAINRHGVKDITAVRYTGLGHLQWNKYTANGVNILGQSLTATVDETFTNDALGNVHTAVETFTVSVGGGWYGSSGMQSSTNTKSSAYQATTGRLTSQTRYLNQQTYQYDLAGNNILTSLHMQPPPGSAAQRYDDRVTTYNAVGQIVASERRIHSIDAQYGAWEANSWLQRFLEEYRYDPLGRRVVVRAETKCHVYGGQQPANCDLGQLRRTVWAGNNELVEIQRPVDGVGGGTLAQMESDTSQLLLPVRTSSTYVTYVDPNPFYGRTAYTHGQAVDRPLSLTRFAYVDRWRNVPSEPAYAWPTFTLVPHWNVRGEAVTGTFANGAARMRATVSGRTRFVGVTWSVAGLAYNRLSNDTLGAWQGTLISQKRDMVGTLYRRNRSYDPSAGRFTQEDPIGFAGGLNLYGYAGGDPINFGDPFGLCKIDVKFSPVIRGYHAFIVTTAPDNTRTGSRGGPERDAPGSSSGQLGSASSGSASGASSGQTASSGTGSSGSSNASSPGASKGNGSSGPWGALDAAGGQQYDRTFADYNREHHTQRVLDNDEPCDKYIASFAATAAAINGANIAYNPLTTNSNAVVSTMLRRAGIPVPRPAVRAYGWGTSLLP